jgi:basic membrane protein A
VDAPAGQQIARGWVEDQQVDVIFGAAGLTGSAAIFEAAGRGAWVIGVDQDEYRTTFNDGALDGAARLLTSAVKRVDVGVYQAIDSILNGTFTSGVLTLSAADCGIGYADWHDAAADIPAPVKTRLAAIWRALAGGTLNTGASGLPGDEPPPPLPGDALPPIADDAPTLASCAL